MKRKGEEWGVALGLEGEVSWYFVSVWEELL